MSNARHEPVNIREAILVLLILLGALFVRAWGISGTTLDHFDEGVYAFSALGVSDSSQPRVMYPNQEIFSPPFYFAVGGTVARVFGMAPDQALLIVSIIFGMLTVAAAWWFARAGFGRAAALATAIVLAFNPFHIAFSRSALTDITFTFWLTLAIGALVLAIERSSWKWTVFAGLATGVAWNTKYHGWFALMICGAALVPYAWRLRRAGGAWKRPFLHWGAATAIGFLCYLPWMIYLRSRPGGYQGMARHYLGMLRTEWLNNFWRYGEMLGFFEGPTSRIAIALAVVAVMAVGVRRAPAVSRLIPVTLLLSVSILLLGGAGTAFLLSLAAVPFLLRGTVSYRVWVLLAWGAIWVLAAPVYNPYARLILPFVVAMSIGAGAGLAYLAAWMVEQPVPARARKLQWAMVSVFLLAVVPLSFAAPNSADPWRRDRGMKAAAAALADHIPVGSRVIAVIEPPAAFYLHRSGRPAFERTGDLLVFDTLSTPAYVITGTYVRRAPRLRKQLARISDQLTPIDIVRIDPYDVRLLDDLTPDAARSYRAKPDSTFDLHLFRFNPKVDR